jgi:hypothetical protein
VPLGIAAVLVSVLAIGFGSPSSFAAPGGSGNGNPTLTVAPVSIIASLDGHDVRVSGSDFRQGKPVLLYITESMPVVQNTDRDGSFSFVQTLDGSGPWSFTAFQYWGGKWNKVAVTTYPSP